MSKTYPVLPLRDIVVFPHMIVTLFFGCDKSVKALMQVIDSEKKILIVAQKDANIDEQEVKNRFSRGSFATVLYLLKFLDVTVKVLVECVLLINVYDLV